MSGYTLTVLGDFGVNGISPYFISEDGTTIVGEYFPNDWSNTRTFRVKNGVFQDLGDAGGQDAYWQYERDGGDTVLMSSSNADGWDRVIVWKAATGLIVVEPPSPNEHVGLVWAHEFDPSAPLECFVIYSSPNGSSGYVPHVCGADGEIVASMVLPVGWESAIPTAHSEDCSVVFGVASVQPFTGSRRPFRWVVGSAPTLLTNVAGGEFLYGVTRPAADGSAAIFNGYGASELGIHGKAVLWTADDGVGAHFVAVGGAGAGQETGTSAVYVADYTQMRFAGTSRTDGGLFSEARVWNGPAASAPLGNEGAAVNSVFCPVRPYNISVLARFISGVGFEFHIEGRENIVLHATEYDSYFAQHATSDLSRFVGNVEIGGQYYAAVWTAPLFWTGHINCTEATA